MKIETVSVQTLLDAPDTTIWLLVIETPFHTHHATFRKGQQPRYVAETLRLLADTLEKGGF